LVKQRGKKKDKSQLLKKEKEDSLTEHQKNFAQIEEIRDIPKGGKERGGTRFNLQGWGEAKGKKGGGEHRKEEGIRPDSTRESPKSPPQRKRGTRWGELNTLGTEKKGTVPVDVEGGKASIS